MMTTRQLPVVLAGMLILGAQAHAQNKPSTGGTPPDVGAGLNVAPEPQAPAPRIAFEDVNHDFGRIASGQVVRHDFVFTNLGTAPLEIRSVRPGCGCTTAGTWDTLIPPGKTGKIPIGFNSGTFSGNVTKSVSVTCNDPGQPNVYLQIKASIWSPVSISPLTAFFNLTSESTNTEPKVIRLTSHLDEPLELSEPQITNTAFTATLKTITPGKEFDLLVSPVLPLPSTYTSAVISMKTSSAQSPVLTVHASAMMQPVVSVMPSVVTLSDGSYPGAAKPAVTVRSTAASPLTLTNAMIRDLPGASVDVKELQPGRLFRLTFLLPADAKLEPGRRLEATVETSHPNHAKLSIPIVAAPRSNRPAPAPTAPPTPARPTVLPGRFLGPVTQ